MMFCFLDLIVYQAATTLAKRWQCAVKKDLGKTPRLNEVCKFVMESRALRRQESAEKSLPNGTGAVDGEGGKAPEEAKAKQETVVTEKAIGEAIVAETAAPAAPAIDAETAAPAAPETTETAAPASPKEADDEAEEVEAILLARAKEAGPKVDMDGQEIRVNDIVLTHAVKQKGLYHGKRVSSFV